jgi:Methyltransferase FkbM domain
MIVIVRWSLVVFKHLINRSNYTAGAAIDHDPSASSYPKVPVSRLDLRRSPLRSIVMDTLSLLSPMRPARVNKIRVGRNFDGGYVMLSDLERYTKALSLGISGDDSWDLEMVRRGYVVHQYDYSIAQAPTQHEQLTFFPLKIATGSNAGEITLKNALDRLATDLHEPAILKMDIEGSEWDVIPQTNSQTMKRFSQIVCEFHGLNELSNPLQHDRIRRTFSTIYETHQPVHIHANNYGMIFNVDNIPVPDVLEVTYANRNLYKFKPSDDVYPTPLDQPNNPETPDIFLGTFKFA